MSWSTWILVGTLCLVLVAALAVAIYFAVTTTSTDVDTIFYVDDLPSAASSVNLTDTTLSIKSHSALHWNGVDSYLSIPHCFNTGNDNFILAIMLRMASVTTAKTATIIGKWNVNYLDDVTTAQTYPVGYGLSYNASTLSNKLLQLEIGNGINSTIQTFTWANTSLDDNEWHLLIINVSRQNATETSCYIDGVLQSARYNTYVGGVTLDNDGPLLVGKLPDASSSSIDSQSWMGDLLLVGVLDALPTVAEMLSFRANHLPV